MRLGKREGGDLTVLTLRRTLLLLQLANDREKADRLFDVSLGRCHQEALERGVTHLRVLAGMTFVRLADGF